MPTKTLSRHNINQLNRDELRAELNAAHQIIRDFEAQNQPLRDCLVEISARSLGHKRDGNYAASEEANACADLIEKRLSGDWWLEVDALKMCQKDDDPLNS